MKVSSNSVKDYKRLYELLAPEVTKIVDKAETTGNTIVTQVFDNANFDNIVEYDYKTQCEILASSLYLAKDKVSNAENTAYNEIGKLLSDVLVAYEMFTKMKDM